MAKRKRGFKGLTTLSFGMLPSLPASVNTKGLGMGAALGLIAGLAARYAENTYAPATWTADAVTNAKANPAKAFIHEHLPGLAAIAVGVAAYFIQKKRGKSGGGDLLVGAGLTGAALVAMPFAQSVAGAKFKGLTTLNFGGYRGLYLPVTDGGTAKYNGIVVPAASRPGTQGEIAAPIRGYVAAKTMQNQAQFAALRMARSRR